MLNKSKTVDFYVLKVLYSDSAINFAHKSCAYMYIFRKLKFPIYLR